MPWGWRSAFITLAVGYALVTALLVRHLRRAAAIAASAATGHFLEGLRVVISTPWARCVLAAAFAEGVLLLGDHRGVMLCGLAFDRGGPAWLLLPTVVGAPLAAWAFAKALRRRTAQAA